MFITTPGLFYILLFTCFKKARLFFPVLESKISVRTFSVKKSEFSGLFGSLKPDQKFKLISSAQNLIKMLQGSQTKIHDAPPHPRRCYRSSKKRSSLLEF